MAATMLAAWALNPPMLPAMAEPTRFLLMFSATRSAVLLFNTCTRIEALISTFRFRIWSFGFVPICLYLPDHLRRNGGLTNHGLSSAHNPVYGGGFLVSAVVAADCQDLRVWVELLEPAQGLLSPLRKTALTALGTQKYQHLPKTTKKTNDPPLTPCSCPWRLLSQTGNECISFSQPS